MEKNYRSTQNILNVISDECKIIFPSTHVVYEGIEQVKTDILEDEKKEMIKNILSEVGMNFDKESV